MNVHLGCRSIRSGHWAIEKVPTPTEMMYDKSRVIKAISKYSFLSEEQKRKILRGYCRVIGPVVYIYIYILGREPSSRTSSSPRMGKRCHGSPH